MNDGQPHGLLLAEANPDVAQALGLYLDQVSGLRLLGHVRRMQALLHALEAQQPRLLLLDWTLPGFVPRTDLTLLREARPELYVIGMGSDVQTETTALALGANAFVGKSESVNKLTQVLMRAIACLTHADVTHIVRTTVD